MESFITSTGEGLSEEDIEALADEAERGYDLGKAIGVIVGSLLAPRPRISWIAGATYRQLIPTRFAQTSMKHWTRASGR